MLCGGCGRPAHADWRRAIRAARTEARAQRPLRGEAAGTARRRHRGNPLRAEGYRSLLGRALLTRTCLSVATAVIAADVAVFTARWWTAPEHRLSVRDRTVDLDVLARVTTLAVLGAVALTAAAFVAWSLRAYRNLPALGINHRRYWTVWVVVGWLLPGLNLILPKLLIADIWRGSHPHTPYGDDDRWLRRPVASVVHTWWSSVLLAPAIGVIGWTAVADHLTGTEANAVISAVNVAAAAVLAVAASAARRIVAIVTVGQAHRADVVVDVRDRITPLLDRAGASASA